MPRSDQQTGTALGEGLFWMAEKCLWGYEDTVKDPAEALKLYRQAADLGISDALIRIGEMHENGIGVPQSAAEALVSYQRAAERGNFLALAFIAKLLSRTVHALRANAFWEQFLTALDAQPDRKFLAESMGGVLHSYIEMQLRAGAEPKHLGTLRVYRTEIVSRHQQLLEHATSDERLARLEDVGNWLVANLA